MTNTRNTPVEILERMLPVRVKRYAVRAGSGGAGEQPGGDGIIRELEALAPLDVGLLTERRLRAPWGLAGGRPGKKGRNRVFRGGTWHDLPGKTCLTLAPGDRLCIETPGGGGYGKKT